MIKSRQHFILIPLTILVAFGSGLLLFIVYIIIVNNLTNLGDFDIIAMTLFLTSIAIFPLIMMLSLLRKFKIHSDKLEVVYAFRMASLNSFQKSPFRKLWMLYKSSAEKSGLSTSRP